MLRPRADWAADVIDSRFADIVAKTIGIDPHNHIDVPLTAAEMPGPDIDLAAEMKRSGLSAICMTFATDYQQGDAYDRFLKGLASMDRQLTGNDVKRSFTPADVRAAHENRQPTVIQAIEGAHFLEGKLERVEEAYGRGLRHFGVLRDGDASEPLGDVYTNPPRYGGLTAFGAAVIKECNRLGILIDLAHADVQTTEAALKVTTRPVIISHTGLDTQLGSNPSMAGMMRPRLIGKEQAKTVANARGRDRCVDASGRYAAGVCKECSGAGRCDRSRNYIVVDAMLKTGFTSDEIGKIGGGNFLRIFSEAVKK
jgi:membrane dipeptidase